MTIVWPYIISFALLTSLGWYSWRSGNVPGARAFAIAILFAVLWLAGAVGELMASDVATKILWLKFQVIFQLPVVTAITLFVLEYANPERRLTWRWLLSLSIPPFLVLGLVLTNNHHHWFWRGFQYNGALQPLRGPANWIMLGYGMTLVLVSLVVFARLFLRSPEHRWPVILMLIAQISGRIFFALNLASNIKVFGMDPLIIGFVTTYGIYAVALFGFRILNPLPAAQRTAIKQMRDGMLVFDTGWRVLSFNPAAEVIFEQQVIHIQGQTWGELLPDHPNPNPEGYFASSENPPAIQLDRGTETRRYGLDLSCLQDRGKRTIGYLLMLHDETEQYQAQQRQLKEKWSEATLQERELLAQELHDGIAQNLGFLNLQAQATRLYLRSGDEEAALSSLDRLAEVALALQGETREMIGDLLTVSQASEGLCSVISQVVDHFQEQTGLFVHMELTDDLDEICTFHDLPAATGMQILRILQETLANIRKHAGTPNHIGVQLKANDMMLEMRVEDNGQGFEPAGESNGNHFGLLVMEQRAARIGGKLTVYSAPGQGTRVELSVPLNANMERIV